MSSSRELGLDPRERWSGLGKSSDPNTNIVQELRRLSKEYEKNGIYQDLKNVEDILDYMRKAVCYGKKNFRFYIDSRRSLPEIREKLKKLGFSVQDDVTMEGALEVSFGSNQDG